MESCILERVNSRRKQLFRWTLFALFACVSAVGAVRVEAATLRLSPGAGSFVLGSTFDVSLILNTEGVSVNTIAAELHFPPNKIQIANPSLGKSIVQVWATQPIFSNQEGRIYFVGGIPSPGITTSQGVVQSLTFRVVAPGEATISFGNETQVLANDGLGTNVLKQTSPARFRFILPPSQGPEVFSPTHPEQGKWYKDPNPTFIWDKSVGSEGFSFHMDHDPNGTPDASVDSAESQTSFTDLESGAWYFHVRERAAGVWSGTSHYLVNIDTVSPAAFDMDTSPGTRTTSRSPIVRFFTTDALSGFDHFEIKVVSLSGEGAASAFFFEAASPYQLSALKPGRYETVVRAYDKAGNVRDESVTLTILSSGLQLITSEGVDLILFFVPWRFLLPIFILIALGLGVALVRVWNKHRHHLAPAVKRDFARASRVFGGRRKPHEQRL